MKLNVLAVVCSVFMGAGSCIGAAEPAAERPQSQPSTPSFDIKKVQSEIDAHYAAAQPEIKEYILWTAKSFAQGGMWLQEDAFSGMDADAREKRIEYLATLLNESEYGRHLCKGLAEASALKDKRLVPGLMKVAAYQLEGRDYDCRPKWMALAALARQQSEAAVPLLISLVDHGNENTRNWARAALSRQTGQDFKRDKSAWAKWWQDQGHPAIDEKFLKPWQPPVQPANSTR